MAATKIVRVPFFLILVFCAAAGSASAEPETAHDPLPSWNNGPTKTAIIDFVKRVTDGDSPDFVPEAERVATFDNDGTLWAEQPVYFQIFFALDRLKEMAADHPEWRTTEPFQSALAGDMKGLLASGIEGLEKIVFVTHANLTAEEFEQAVRGWLKTAKHPTTGKPFTQMVYQPMLELLSYLRAHGFKTYIVSGGGVDFMRVFSDSVYGIPPEQVVGTTLDAKFELRDGIPTIVKTGKIEFVDDKTGKPVGIYRQIGRRPLFAAGNSDGDLEMLQYTTIPRNQQDTTPRFGLLIHHTDAKREWAYDRNSKIGHLEKALDQAQARGWQVVNMKTAWKQIYPDKATPTPKASN